MSRNDCSILGWGNMKSVFLLFFASIFFLSSFAYAGDATLEWDENSDADYYVVYWSTAPNSFTEENSMEIPGDMTFVELEDSSDGKDYYYTVKAYNECGNSSDFSDTVKSAHLPIEGSYGAAVSSKSISTVVGMQAENGGCFIGSIR